MAFEQREGSGVLFRNDRKEPGSNAPDMKGNALINGVDMEVAAWTKEGKKGKFLSLSIKPKRDAGPGGSRPSKPMLNDSETLPF